MRKALLASALVLTLFLGSPPVPATAATGTTSSSLEILTQCLDQVLPPGTSGNNDTLLQKVARLAKFRQCAVDSGFTLPAALTCVNSASGSTLTVLYTQVKQCITDTRVRVGAVAAQLVTSGYAIDVFRGSVPPLSADARAIVADLTEALGDGTGQIAALRSALAAQQSGGSAATLRPEMTTALAGFSEWNGTIGAVLGGWQGDLDERRTRYLSAASALAQGATALTGSGNTMTALVPSTGAISAKVTGTIDDLKTVAQGTAAVAQVLATLAEALPGITSDLQQINTGLDGANRAMTQMNAAIGQVNQSLDEMNRSIAAANVAMDQINAGIKQANAGMDQMIAGLDEMNAGMDQMNAAVADFPNIKAMLGSGMSLSNFGDFYDDPFQGTPEERLQRLNDQQSRDQYMSLLLGVTPGIGDALGLSGAITGKDVVTGQPLNGTERALGAVFVLGYVKGIGKAADLAGVTGKLNKAGGVLKKTKDAVAALRAGASLPAGWTTRVLSGPPAGLSKQAGVTWTEAVLSGGGAKLFYSSDGRIYAQTDEGLTYLGTRTLDDVGDACLNSFRPETRVVLGGGGTAPIASLRAGDLVLAGDTITGRPVPEPVTAVHVHTDTELTDVTVAGGGPDAVVHTTGEHPFWDADARAWVDAEDLAEGTALRTPAGVTAEVAGVRSFTGSQDMYNLTVAGYHTYFVHAGDTAVLVHNCPMARSPNALKNVKLPKSLNGVDIPHVRENHVPGGAGVHSGKNLWPSTVTDDQITEVAASAFRSNPRVVGWDSGTRMIQAQARVNGKLYEFIINKDSGIMRTIYPKLN
ncbi:polymorphic toxin-type HINT domain-containing protein [Actinoplanes palleronii]|uniref:polymorphic toxin-type HINT domain-containing protein n=1 Tax=Actinoplanes palleronii TaxID=113570 RepID=UPI001940AA12|nr:polymorphic toxin-type HINT domain-containing protein [Actinoplanes palleronii]